MLFLCQIDKYIVVSLSRKDIYHKAVNDFTILDDIFHVLCNIIASIGLWYSKPLRLMNAWIHGCYSPLPPELLRIKNLIFLCIFFTVSVLRFCPLMYTYMFKLNRTKRSLFTWLECMPIYKFKKSWQWMATVCHVESVRCHGQAERASHIVYLKNNAWHMTSFVHFG